MSAESVHPAVAALVVAGFESQILYPSTKEYTDRNDSYWCNNAKLSPACIVQPRNATEVSQTIKALADAQQPFAVRSGGHTNWAGSNNINDGVTVDLRYLDTITYDSSLELVHMGPGMTWGAVYAYLKTQGRVVAGGRATDVGVGGLLLGGGNTFYTGRHGFACDNVVEYEVVLADGRVVNVDAAGAQADLFRALKGGGNNFGVVTRFTMRTLPSGPVWGGLAVSPLDVLPAALEATVDFTARSHEFPDDSIMTIVGHLPALGGDVCAQICVNVAGNETSPAVEKITALPSMFNTYKLATLEDMFLYTALPPNY
jgi:FAD/FMN-containing dehydrogenase